MKKEPIEYFFEIMVWLLVPTIKLTENSSKKWVRVAGILVSFPLIITWVVTGIPFLLCGIVLLIAQLCVDA